MSSYFLSPSAPCSQSEIWVDWKCLPLPLILFTFNTSTVRLLPSVPSDPESDSDILASSWPQIWKPWGRAEAGIHLLEIVASFHAGSHVNKHRFCWIVWFEARWWRPIINNLLVLISVSPLNSWLEQRPAWRKWGQRLDCCFHSSFCVCKTFKACLSPAVDLDVREAFTTQLPSRHLCTRSSGSPWK